MQKNIQIRHVPEDVHRALRVRAAASGMTLSDYLLAEVTAFARRPTLAEVFERISKREGVRVRTDSATAVRAERDGRR
jgi:plasmid stability protein